MKCLEGYSIEQGVVRLRKIGALGGVCMSAATQPTLQCHPRDGHLTRFK